MVRRESTFLTLGHARFSPNINIHFPTTGGLPGGSVVKNPPVNAGDAGLIPGLGKSPGGGSGNPLQYYCLGNPMDRGGWWTTVHGVTKSRTVSAAAKLHQSCLTLCEPIDGSPTGSPVPGILLARSLEWVAISFSNA